MVSVAQQPRGARTVALDTLRKGERGVVQQVLEIDSGVVGDQVGASIGRRLVEIGFVPGERVQIIEMVWPGGDPMAVRVGSTVFALRRREAQAVLVQVDSP
ncbi:MAG TPA: FeoA family protein [Steroidobacteraceae bacterium]|nr:FeoA family protein [Steroidobacteraceae bacterium]